MSVSDFKLCNLIIMYLSNLLLKKIKIKVISFPKDILYVPIAVYQQGTYMSQRSQRVKVVCLN